ncbi:MAG: hypothetical protein EOP81_05020 [Variovorax sp.]|nr:MAG: hypothetical protein EOP81_05020 [Variovorax sp.]
MTPKSPEAPLIEDAMLAIEQVLARVQAAAPGVLFYSPTELAKLPVEAQAVAQSAEAESYRSRPEHSAVHFCLTSACALLDVSQTLLNSPIDPSPHERERQWKQLVAHTKTAGRSAYRAALILADPQPPARKPSGVAADAQVA